MTLLSWLGRDILSYGDGFSHPASRLAYIRPHGMTWLGAWGDELYKDALIAITSD